MTDIDYELSVWRQWAADNKQGGLADILNRATGEIERLTAQRDELLALVGRLTRADA